MIIDFILFGFIFFSIYSDIRFRKIFNYTVLSSSILGFGLNFYFFGIKGLETSFYGFIAGFSFLFVFYLLKGVGAGDVKFMAAVGALKGMKFVLIGGLYGALAGGTAAIFVLITKKRFLPVVKKVFFAILLFLSIKTKESLEFNPKDSIYLPYTVFLSIGMVIHWLELYFK
ncbi:MAG: A24 family peptidase [Elusimicrobia bacterium]|nr:A24 family peptidase [Candidatus Liberimonas magnetica]